MKRAWIVPLGELLYQFLTNAKGPLEAGLFYMVPRNSAVSLHGLVLDDFKRLLSATHNHHASEGGSSNKKEENAGVDWGARKVATSCARKIWVVVITCSGSAIACIIYWTARELCVSAWDFISGCYCGIANLSIRRCGHNKHRTYH